MAAYHARAGRDNNFHLIRHLAAIAVVLTHSYSIVTGLYEDEPLVGWFGQSIGYYAVLVFFVLSGFLITQSLDRDGDLLRFAVSRTLRIFPALTIAVVLTVFVIGPIATTETLATYFSSSEVPIYLVGALTTLRENGSLPGVFADLPDPDVVNVPLWTLKYEFAAYGSLACLAAFGAITSRRAWTCVALAILLVHLAGRWLVPLPEIPAFADNAFRLFVAFYIGAGFYLARQAIPLNLVGVVALAGVAVVAAPTVFDDVSATLFIAYTMFWLAFLPKLGGLDVERIGDSSYGLYIFAFPIQQMLRLWIPDITPLALFGLALLVTAPIALLSWHVVEKPSLGARDRITTALRARAARFNRFPRWRKSRTNTA